MVWWYILHHARDVIYSQSQLTGIKMTIKRKRRTHDEFIQEAKLAHGDRYDYSAVNWINMTTVVKIRCDRHGLFEQKPFHHVSGNGCKACGIEARSGLNSSNSKRLASSFQDSKVVLGLHGVAQYKCDKHGLVETTVYRLQHGGTCQICEEDAQLIYKTDWQRYRYRVRQITEIQWNNKQEFFNHYGKERSRTDHHIDHHIDHQFSIYDGFHAAIPPYIVGHWTNLVMLPARDNIKKHKQSIIDQETLFKNYFWAIQKFNEV